MVRPEKRTLTPAADPLRQDIQVILQAAVAAVSPDRLVARELADAGFRQVIAGRRLHLLAVGKAAPPMASAFLRNQMTVERGLVIGTHRGEVELGSCEWRQGGHPVPDERSVAAGRDALAFARAVATSECLIVLLSGGASATMAVPLDDLSIDDKRIAVSALLSAGADITALNTIRKHLSAIKGGRLAAACRGMTMTLAVSDVVGDDPGVIGSGPTVCDTTEFADAARVIDELGVAGRLPRAVMSLIEAGVRGEIEETVKPGDPRLARAEWRLIGGRHDAMAEARQAAEKLGYHAIVLTDPIVGEARQAGSEHVQRIRSLLGRRPEPTCFISSGETTVKVVGNGVGGRNQEFTLAAGLGASVLPAGSTIASAGTDGIDGPTDAAGAVADTRTLARAATAGLADPLDYLARNDSYHFFASLGDLIITGPTDTNVGDVQVVLVP